jgi:hypothetical protein
MLDPTEQAKGGFRAQMARAKERQDAIKLEQDTRAATTPSEPPASPLNQADGADPDAPPSTEPLPAPAPVGRQPKRWH